MDLKCNNIIFMADVIRQMRIALWKQGFTELLTPIIRKYKGFPHIPRFKLEDGRFLRESAALALRRNLAYAPKIFEIAPCMRPDPIDATHLQQFTMLDLYQKDASLEDMISLCTRLIRLFYTGPIKTLSVSQQIRDEFGIDLSSDQDSLCKLEKTLAAKYNRVKYTLTELISEYIMNEVEPKSKKCCSIVTEFPIAAEILAKPKEGAIAIADNAEFQMNGMEVINLYQDDPDITRFKKRSQLYQEQHSIENDIISNLIENGEIPRKSAGFGIGIERLCQVCLGLDSIQSFVVSQEFISEVF